MGRVNEQVIRRDGRDAFHTKDGSQVTELVHPSFAPVERQSIAEAVVPPGGETIAHVHRLAEEIYMFTSGCGRMSLGDSEFQVAPGDSAVIAPGTPHKLWNTGDEPLILLCVCAPAYSHEDTELLE